MGEVRALYHLLWYQVTSKTLLWCRSFWASNFFSCDTKIFGWYHLVESWSTFPSKFLKVEALKLATTCFRRSWPAFVPDSRFKFLQLCAIKWFGIGSTYQLCYRFHWPWYWFQWCLYQVPPLMYHCTKTLSPSSHNYSVNILTFWMSFLSSFWLFASLETEW